MPYVFGELKDGGIRICQECGEVTLEDESHWHDDPGNPAKCSICGKGPNFGGVAVWALADNKFVCDKHNVRMKT